MLILRLLLAAPAACEALKGVDEDNLYLRVIRRSEPEQQLGGLGIISDGTAHPKEDDALLYEPSYRLLCPFQNTR